MATKRRRAGNRAGKAKPRSPKPARSTKPATAATRPLLSMTRQGFNALRARVADRKEGAALSEALERLEADYLRVLELT